MVDRCLRTLTPNRPRPFPVYQARVSFKPATPPPKSLYLFRLMDITKDGILDLNSLRSLTSLLPASDHDFVLHLLKRHIISARSFKITREKFIEIYEQTVDQDYSQCEELNSVWRYGGEQD